MKCNDNPLAPPFPVAGSNTPGFMRFSKEEHIPRRMTLSWKISPTAHFFFSGSMATPTAG